jgi:hypothetical protein
LKITQWYSEAVNRRKIDNTIVKRKGTQLQTMVYKTLWTKLTITQHNLPPSIEKWAGSEHCWCGRVDISCGLHYWYQSCYSRYKPGEKVWMRRGPDCYYDKQNIYVVIFTQISVTVSQFMVATSILSLGTLGSVTFSSVTTLYQENDDMNHKQWNNIVLLRDVFYIGLVIGPRPAVLAWGAVERQYSRPRTYN